MALPALSRAYSARRDCLLPDRSTATLIAKSHVWSLKAHLMDQIATGTLGPTARDPASVWTCLGSSDGAAGGLDAVDRWGSTFNGAKIVFAGHGVAHSWIALQNTTFGMQLVIDCQNSETNVLLSMCRNAQPLSGGLGGTVSQRPYVLSDEINFGYTTSDTGNWISTFIADQVLVQNQRTNFVCGPDGSFLFFMKRDGSGFSSSAVGVQNPQNASYFPKRAGDLNAHCFIGPNGASNSAPGAFGLSTWMSAGVVAQRLNSGAIMSTGGLSRFAFGGNNFDNAGVPVDPFTLDYQAFPLGMLALSPQSYPRGVIADYYFHGNRTLIPECTPNNPSGITTHIAIGDFWIPWDGPAPTV